MRQGIDRANDPASVAPNVKQAVPFLWVSDMEASLQFYNEGLGFELRNRWVEGGKVRWCLLALGGASLMLQEFSQEGAHARPAGKLGQGVVVYFMCEDALALYRDFKSRGLAPAQPSVGNGMWVTSLTDPSGYDIKFESATDAPEETRYDG